MVIYNKTNFGIFIDGIRIPSKTSVSFEKVASKSDLNRLRNSGKIIIYNTFSKTDAIKDSKSSVTIPNASLDTDHKNTKTSSKKVNKKPNKSQKNDTIINENY